MTPSEAIATLRAIIDASEGQSADAYEAITTLDHYDPWQCETLWKVLAGDPGVGSRHQATRVLDLIERAVGRT